MALTPKGKATRQRIVEGAALYLRSRDTVLARALLAPLAYQPHDKELSSTATQLIGLIDSGKIENAIEQLDAEPAQPASDPAKPKAIATPRRAPA